MDVVYRKIYDRFQYYREERVRKTEKYSGLVSLSIISTITFNNNNDRMVSGDHDLIVNRININCEQYVALREFSNITCFIVGKNSITVCICVCVCMFHVYIKYFYKICI